MAILETGKRSIKRLGAGDAAVVLGITSPALQARWQEALDAGAEWDHDGFNPHVTLSWDKDHQNDISAIEPYQSDIILGREIHKPILQNWDKAHQPPELIAGSLYVSRRVLNPMEILLWAARQGIVGLQRPDELHVTVVYSKRPLNKDIGRQDDTIINRGVN